MIVEPCCCDKQLSELICQKQDTAFVTNGDVLLHHFLHAVSCLVGNKMDIVIVKPHINIEIAEKMSEFFRRGWLNALYILAEDKQETVGIIRSHCKEYIDDILFAETKKLGNEMLGLLGTSGIVINGPILTKPTFALTSYGVTFSYIFMPNRDMVNEIGEYTMKSDPFVSGGMKVMADVQIQTANDAIDALLRPYISKFRLSNHEGEYPHRVSLLNFKYLWKR